MQISPVKELLPFIRHYLFLESRGNDLQKLRLFSDGSMGIVFSFNSTLLNGSDKVEQLEQLPGSFLYGQISKYKDVFLNNETDLIIVVFQPSGISQLMGIPANKFSDAIIRTEYVFNKPAEKLYAKLAEQFTIMDKVLLLNTFFSEQRTKRIITDNSVIREALNFIIKNNGLVSSQQLIKLTGYTERYVERKFIESIGITPKKFSNIIKLHTFLKELKNNSKKQNFTSLAYEAGYADQSHLIKEFKKITGMTPKIYQNDADKLAVNFVKFN